MRPSPTSAYRTFSFCKTETLLPVKQLPTLPSPAALHPVRGLSGSRERTRVALCALPPRDRLAARSAPSSGLCVPWQASECPSFVRPNGTPLCGGATFCSSSSVGGRWAASAFGRGARCSCGHCCARSSSRPCLRLLWARRTPVTISCLIVRAVPLSTVAGPRGVPAGGSAQGFPVLRTLASGQSSS